MADVILLGSGFSKAISSSMPLLNDLSEELRSKVPDIPGNNVEHWMTYLSQSYPWQSESENLRNRALFLDLTQNIRQVLSEKTDLALTQCPECPTWLQTFLKYCHERRENIITLNYDTLVESAVLYTSIGLGSQGKDKHMYLDDIYPVPMTPGNRRRSAVYLGSSEHVDSLSLFKLHGSINWYYSGALASTGETIYYSHIRQWTETEDDANKYKDETGQYLSDKVPLLVPPVMEKVSYFQHETIRTIWSQAGQALQSANRVICIGYSLPETDLSFRFFLEKNAPKKAVSLIIINPDVALPRHYAELLEKFFKIDDSFVGRAIDEQLISNIFL